jgi:dTDP-glucose 4,6-dehydratase
VCAIVDELRPDLPHRPCADLIRFVEDRPGHDARYAIDPTKAKRELGWEPRYHLEQGLRETVAWYLDHPGWVERVTSGVYQRERLGLAH